MNVINEMLDNTFFECNKVFVYDINNFHHIYMYLFKIFNILFNNNDCRLNKKVHSLFSTRGIRCPMEEFS